MHARSVVTPQAPAEAVHEKRFRPNRSSVRRVSLAYSPRARGTANQEVARVSDTTTPGADDGRETAATIDLTANQWGLPAAGSTIFDFDYTSGRDQLLRLYDKGTRRQWVASDRIDWTVDVDWENPLGVPDASISLAGTSYWERMNDTRARRSAPSPGRVAVLAVPPRRARCAHVRVEDREHGPDDRRQVLRRDAGHRRGAARRGLRPLPAREARPRVSAEHQPSFAARRRVDRQRAGT